MEPVTVTQCYLQLEKAAYAVAWKLTQGRWWLVRSTGLIVAFSLFLAFPSYQDFSSVPNQAGKTWQAVLAKGENLRWNVLERFGPSTNAARVNFRLTGPVLSRILPGGIPTLVLVQALAGVMLLGLCIWLATSASKCRAVGLITAAGIGTTWAGVTSFCELRGVFDGIALCLILGAMASRRFAVAAACVFIALWTDERALVSFPLLFVSSWLLYRTSPEYRSWCRAAINGPLMGMIFGLLAHLLSRLVYASWAEVPHKFDGNGLEILLNQINNIPMGIWSALEGGWLVVIGAAIVTWSRGKWLWSLLFFSTLGIVLVVAFAVVDISRTTAFALPALFAGMGLLRGSESVEGYKRIVFLSSFLSVLWPMYYVGGKATIWWVYPLPMQLIRLMAGR